MTAELVDLPGAPEESRRRHVEATEAPLVARERLRRPDASRTARRACAIGAALPALAGDVGMPCFADRLADVVGTIAGRGEFPQAC